MNLKLTERVLAREVDGKMTVEAIPEPDVPEEFWTARHG